MDNLVSFLVGLVATPVALWLVSKIAPRKTAMWLSKQLSKLIKDPAAVDKIEDALGEQLIELGKAIIEAHKIGDEPER